MTAEEMLKTLDSIGWFEGMPEAQVAEIREELRERLPQDPDYGFNALAEHGYDAESIFGGGEGEPQTAATLVAELARASHGVFTPTDIEDDSDLDDDWVRVSFTVAGRRFKAEEASDFVGVLVLGVINQALEHAGKPERLYVLEEDPPAVVVFKRPEVWDAAVERGLVRGSLPGDPFGDDLD